MQKIVLNTIDGKGCHGAVNDGKILRIYTIKPPQDFDNFIPDDVKSFKEILSIEFTDVRSVDNLIATLMDLKSISF